MPCLIHRQMSDADGPLTCGFTLEGTMRSALLHEDGWHDEHLHA